MISITYVTDGKRHLICQPFSVDNLHKMAEELEIHRCWFHAGKFPHYDIPKRRQEEIEKRCQIISPKSLLNIIKGKTGGSIS